MLADISEPVSVVVLLIERALVELVSYRPRLLDAQKARLH